MKKSRRAIKFLQSELYESTVVSGYHDKFWDLVNSNCWELSTLRIMEEVLDDTFTFIDIGAWIGPYVLFARHKNATVIAYECDQFALEILYQNILINKSCHQKTNVIEKAVWKSEGEMPLYSPNLGGSGSSLVRSKEQYAYRVQCVPFQEIASKKYNTKNLFFKIDVEGSEYFILPDAMSISEKDLICLSLHPNFLKKNYDLKTAMKMQKKLNTFFENFTVFLDTGVDFEMIKTDKDMDFILNNAAAPLSFFLCKKGRFSNVIAPTNTLLDFLKSEWNSQNIQMSGKPQTDSSYHDLEAVTPSIPIAARIAEIEELREKGETAGAIAAAEKLAAEFPRNPRPMNQLAVSHLKAGDTLAAREAFQQARDRGLPERRGLQTLLKILWQESDHQQFIETAEALCEAGGDLSPALLRQLAISQRALGRIVEAERAVDAGLTQHKLPALAMLKANLLFERDHKSGIESEIEGLVTAPNMPPQICHAIRLLHRYETAYSDAVKRLVRLAQERWPESDLVDDVYREIFPEEASTRPTASSATDPQGQLAALLQKEGWPTDMSSIRNKRFIEAIKAQIAPEKLRRWLVSDVQGQEVIVSPRAPSGKVAIVFTGLADRTAFPIMAMDIYLAAANLTAIYLCDHQRLLFCNGVAALGADFVATTEALRALTNSLGARIVVTISTSGGGLGALNYAVALDAKSSLCFSPRTNVNFKFLEKINDRRERAVVRKVNKHVPDELRDVRSQFLAASPRPSVHLVYGEGMAIDRAHAEQLRGIEGVTLHPLPGLSKHGSATHSLLTGRLSHFIEMVASD